MHRPRIATRVPLQAIVITVFLGNQLLQVSKLSPLRKRIAGIRTPTSICFPSVYPWAVSYSARLRKQIVLVQQEKQFWRSWSSSGNPETLLVAEEEYIADLAPKPFSVPSPSSSYRLLLLSFYLLLSFADVPDCRQSRISPSDPVFRLYLDLAKGLKKSIFGKVVYTFSCWLQSIEDPFRQLLSSFGEFQPVTSMF